MKPRPDQSSSSSPPRFLTVDEVAKLLRLNRNTLYLAIKAGEFPGVFRVGKRIRINLDVLSRLGLTDLPEDDLLKWGNGKNALTDF